jgi:hypothetical protein
VVRIDLGDACIPGCLPHNKIRHGVFSSRRSEAVSAMLKPVRVTVISLINVDRRQA